MESMGDRIRIARKGKNMSQEELATAVGSTKAAISRYESGKRQPRIEQLLCIADALDISAEYLLSGSAEVSQIHFSNGVHIYRNCFIPFKVVEPFLEHQSSDSCDIFYQDDYLLIAVEKNSSITDEELKKILDAYTPFREKTAREDAEFMASIEEGEFHTRMNTAFFKLNFVGMQEAVKRIEELTEIPRYRRQDTPAPHPDGAALKEE